MTLVIASKVGQARTRPEPKTNLELETGRKKPENLSDINAKLYVQFFLHKHNFPIYNYAKLNLSTCKVKE